MTLRTIYISTVKADGSTSHLGTSMLGDNRGELGKLTASEFTDGSADIGSGLICGYQSSVMKTSRTSKLQFVKRIGFAFLPKVGLGHSNISMSRKSSPA
jgi:hypothetical protein